MTHHFFVAVLLCAWFCAVHSISDGGPIDPCEDNHQLVADNYSCTRYHMCRQLDFEDEFTTDIAICPADKVFDMVLSECVDYETGFLQDPSGCTTFYGCHPTKETSEGYLRRHYTCPGDLRFNPEEKHCTFKTNVTDDLCNSRDPEQRIIGDVNRLRNNENNNDNLNRFVLRSEQGPTPLLKSNPSQVNSRIPPSGMKNSGLIISTNPNPVMEPNLDRIAQVIGSQLVSLQNRENEKKKKKAEAEKGAKKNNKQ